MAIIKSAKEIAMEKSKSIKKLSHDELQQIKQQQKIDHILSRYYKDKIKPDDLWSYLKNISKPYLIKAQLNLVHSLTFSSSEFEINKRKKGILAIENLKGSTNSNSIEFIFEQLKKVQKDFLNQKEQMMNKIKQELERDPQKRLQTFRQGQQVMVKQMSVEEAINQNKQLKEYLAQMENQFNSQFNQLKQKLQELMEANA